MFIKEKVESIQKEIQSFTDSISTLATTCDEELNRVIFNLEQSKFGFAQAAAATKKD